MFKVHPVDIGRKLKLQFFSCRVSAGFPSPADDYLEKKLDLNEHLIKHPAATFFVRVQGDSMIDAGIHDGDILIVDRAIDPRDNSVVIAVVDGEFTVKRVQKKGKQVYLIPENQNYQPILIDELADFQVWGTVTSVVHSL